MNLEVFQTLIEMTDHFWDHILRMNMIPLFVLFSIFQSGQPAKAERCQSGEPSSLNCCEFSSGTQMTRFSRLQSLDGVCMLSVRSSNSDVDFRSFTFGSDGKFFIFMQPGGNSKKQNSSQSFVFFPNGDIPNSKIQSQNSIVVNSGTGMNWKFDPATALPTSADDCSISIQKKFSLMDSGVQIKNCQNHLVLESKAEVGGDWLSYPEKTSIMRDPKGNSCELKHSDLYHFPDNRKDRLGRHFTSKYKFKNNEDLGRMLKSRCPQLDLTVLKANKNAAEEKRAREILEGIR